LCSVLGENPPYEVIKGYVKRTWSTYELDKIIQVRRGVFVVRFMYLPDKMAVEQRGFYYFDNKPFLVKAWNPDMDLQAESIKSLPLWL